jgi:hypothetical protein
MPEKFIKALKASPQRDGLFNPWWQVDPDHDIDSKGPAIRRRQLKQYLAERVGKAKYLLLGEAVGYQGGHFTGIAMTSERILLGHKSADGILPEQVFSGITPKRTSKPEFRPLGFNEPTATIVWGEIIRLGYDPFEFVIWNACPWHPFNPKKGMLSNRLPDRESLERGGAILRELINLTGTRHLLAVGEKAFGQLTNLGFSTTKVRHPAMGGATQFREQFKVWLETHC